MERKVTVDRVRDSAARLRRRGIEVGMFIMLGFDGEEAQDFVVAVRSSFGKVKRVRPEAVRQNSREFFLVALGFTGAAEE